MQTTRVSEFDHDRMKAFKKAFPIIAATLGAGIVLVLSCPASIAWTLFVTFFAAGAQYIRIATWTRIEEESEARARALLAKTRVNSESLDFSTSKLPHLIVEIEKAVGEALRKERAAMENAVDVICVIDTNGKILSTNNAAQSVWGYKQSQLLGHHISEFLLAETPEETLNPFIGLEKSIEKVIIENRFRKKNGQIIDLLWSAHWSASDGGLFCIAHDITERKHAEKVLAESEKRVRLILESMPAGIAVINKAGYLEFMNQTSYELTGYDREQIGTLRASDLFSFAKELFIPAEFFESATDETKVVSSSGEHIPCGLSVKEIDWNDMVATLVIFMDLRDKYAIERAKREFLAMVSHDLRGPLTSINAVLGLLVEGHLGALNESGRKLSSKTLKESLRLVKMINELLDMEKMQSGMFVFRLAEASVLELARESVEVVEHSANSRGVKVTLEGTDFSCVCDGARIIQVLVNLLDNAIKYTNTGQEVRVELSRADKGCLVSVCNFGRLIPQEKLKSVFESFEQVKPGAATERKGTGLGLAICKRIIEQHSERIWVESTASEGTRFRFSLGTAGLQSNIEDDNKEELLPQGYNN